MRARGGRAEIAVDARSLQGQLRGVGVYTYSLLSALRRLDLDHRITLFLDASLPQPVHVPDFPVRQIAGRGGSVVWEQFHLPRALRGFDLLHCPANAAPYYSPCPVVLTLHDAIFVRRLRDISQVTYPRQILGHLYRKHAYPSCARRAVSVIAVSDVSREEIIGRIGVDSDRIIVVPEALSESFLQAETLPEKEVRERAGTTGPYILAMGAFERRKNVPLLFEMMEILKRGPGPAPKLVLAGTDNLRATRYREEVRDRQIEESVSFLSYLDEPLLKGLYKYAQAFLRPSHSEGFALPALEAMSCGTPVIASDIPVHKEVIGDGGMLLPPDDALKWASQVGRLHDPGVADEYRERGFVRLKSFSWDRAAQAVLQIYESALRG